MASAIDERLLTRPRSLGLWILLGICVLGPRLLMLPLNENDGGDAVARTWLAHYWLAHPHLVGSFSQGWYQFGPLHLYALALAELAWPSLLHAGRVLSLVVGCLTAVPLWTLTRRAFGASAAHAAVVGFAFWGPHIQYSTTSGSEALNLLLVLSAVDRLTAYLETARRADLMGSGLLFTLACATRYDSWLIATLAGAIVLSRTRRLAPSALFAVCAGAFPVAWSCGNWVDGLGPFFPFADINAFHLAWFSREEALWGFWRYRAMCLFFWPGVAVLGLSPFVALSAFVGVARALRKRQAVELLVFLLVPVVLFTVRSTLMGSFAPLTRFTVKELALLLPFVWLGMGPLFRRWPQHQRFIVCGLGAAALAWNTAFAAWSYRAPGGWAATLRPLSAASSMEERLRPLVTLLQHRAAASRGVVIDEPLQGYDDLPVGYFSGIPYELQARRRAFTFETRLRGMAPDLLIRFDGGTLEREGELGFQGGAITFRGIRFREIPGAPEPMRLYERQKEP